MSSTLLKHSWNLTPKAAVALQRKLAPLVLRRDRFGKIKTIAGADLAFSEDKEEAIGAVLVFEFPSLKEIERVYVVAPVRFPYVPGLLSFREAPILLKAFEKLQHRPDMILIDGQGIAHPRRIGIASHLGLLLDRPTIGCAKSRLCGEYLEPNKKRGSFSPLLDHGEQVGAVLRTRDGVKPLFISTGHRVRLESAIRIVLECHSGFRLPKPTREADLWVSQLKKKFH
jgi:deoxyribonuclease V